MSRITLTKRVLKPCKTVSCVYSKVWSEFKDFTQIKRTVVHEKPECYYWNLFFAVPCL